ncbi:hypothetical protein CVT24_011653 [Panaeolus cyanescens]|uniref:Uncharacterized protein n=1 Tax=Panaeolus cyanescens TaxID=181874 RepID=A0A409WEC2_9AGAR|nr:hypothetical protein CVT24_011653 [Panaeolus cyanescens]
MPSYSTEHLLASRDPTRPIGPFDGRVAAHISPHPALNYICTTPNQDWIPVPPNDGFHSLRLRVDLRYGVYDYTLHPQLDIDFYCHHAAIPRRPTSPTDPLSIMWWDPTDQDFVTASGGILLGVGHLSKDKVDRFQALEQDIQKRTQNYRETASPSPCRETLDLIAIIATALSNSIIRLSSLKTPYTQMRFTVTEFQRYFLEMRGLLDYMEIYKPRMLGLLPAASSADPCIGAFTYNELVAQHFHRAGLPVWLLRPWDGEPVSNNILCVVQPTLPDARMEDYDPPFPTVYSGKLGVPAAINSIHAFSRTWLSCKNPFKSSALPSSSNQTVSSSSSHATTSGPSAPRGGGSGRSQVSKKPTKVIQSGRDKFKPLESHLAPFPIPAWSLGLAAVNQSPELRLTDKTTAPQLAFYAFPDPALLISPKEDSKKAKLLTTWLLCRDAWNSAMTSKDSLAMSSQNWRDILFQDFTIIPEAKDTKASESRLKALAKFAPKDLEAFRTEPQYATGQPMTWRGRQYVPGTLPPVQVVREILWELYELNFTYELISLDQHACEGLDLENETALYEREADFIIPCFTALSYKRPVINLPDKNEGLASDTMPERLEFVLAMAKLMSSWRGEKPAIFDLHKRRLQRSISREQASELEKEVARFYCQTLYNYFGRAAQIPHRLYQPL